MRKDLVFALMLVTIIALLMAMPRPCFAEDGKNVPDIVANVLSGRQDSCPTNFTLGLIIEKKVEGIPILNMVPVLNLSRLQTGVRGRTPMGEKFGKEGEVEILADFIWNWD